MKKMCLRAFLATVAIAGLMSAPANAQYGSAAAKPAAGAANSVNQWFNKFDLIVRENMITPAERQKSDDYLIQGMIPGVDKTPIRAHLSMLASRYDKATAALRALTLIPQTEQLQKGYYQYFGITAKLFKDYQKGLDNIAAVDTDGQPLAPKLLQTKADMIALKDKITALNQQMHTQFGLSFATP